MTYPQRLWFDDEKPRPTAEQIEAAGIAFRLKAGLADEDDDDWSFEDEPTPKTDPVLADVWSGVSRRQLAHARDNLAEAKQQYEQAVRQARASGWNWSEIARVLGVSRQFLHQRFRTQPQD